jgi:hypothetical protein
MGGTNTEPTSPYVTNDHCDQVSLRIEQKVDGVTTAVKELSKKLDPKLEMITRVHTYFVVTKGIVLFVLSGGFLVSVWKFLMYLSSKK